jgi:BASS family bile acid:Na+ symporter
MNSGSDISVGNILLPVITTLLIPFVAAQLIKFISPKFWQRLINWKDSSFYILVLNIYIATSEASYYIRSGLTNSLEIIFLIAVVSISLCILFFSLGWWIGGKEYSSEASQSLGQKNNAFTIWISLTFINPIAVLGPVFYVFIQNIYISWELYQHRHSELF